MKLNQYSSNSLAYIGDAYYSLKVREHLVTSCFQKPGKLLELSNKFVSAKSQYEIFYYLKDELNFFNEIELEIFKRGRNSISHIPKSSDLKTYQVSSGFEAVLGYLYLSDLGRANEMLRLIFEWRKL